MENAIILKSELFDNIYEPWLHILSDEKSGIELILRKLNALNLNRNEFCPRPCDWFNFARLTPFFKLKVVIIGQDPYPNDNAHGLAFSSKYAIPQSLKNIYGAIFDNNEMEHILSEKQGNLSSWAAQGILMINAALTTIEGKSNEHASLWRPYTTYIIKQLCEIFRQDNKKLVFILWGVFAQKFLPLIQRYNHYGLLWSHPSPMINNKLTDDKKFHNCTNFYECNVFLKKMSLTPINWTSVFPETHFINHTKEEKKNKKEEKNKKEIIDINKLDEYLSQISKKIICKYIDADSDKIVVFTDGACIANKKPNANGAFAVVFVNGYIKNKIIIGNLSNTYITPSNIRAEGIAILQVLKTLYDNRHKFNNATIVTDSQFWQNMITLYMPKWDDLKFNTQANTDLTKEINKYWKKLRAKEKNVYIEFMYGHNKKGWREYPIDSYEKYCYTYNDVCDKLASWSVHNVARGQMVSFEYDV